MRTLCRMLSAAVDDVLFPRHCLITGAYLGQAQTRLPGVSDLITDALPPAPPPIHILALLQRNFHDDELLLSHAFARYAVQTDSDADKMIYAIKYARRTRLAAALGTEVGATLRDVVNIGYDLVVPVPIHAARLRERGYNQSALIATAAASSLGVSYAEPLTRIHYTGTQTTLDASRRLANVAQAFALASTQEVQALKGARVLLVDDVLTTGATMNACAEVLLNAGVRRVDGAAIAVAL